MPTIEEFEEVEGDAAITWAKQQNEASFAALQGNNFSVLQQEALNILDSQDKLPGIFLAMDCRVYNFWRDDKNERGVFRRTELDQFMLPHDQIPWEILFDLDKIAKDEGENWHFEGYNLLDPYCTNAFISLSDGGCEANVVREFDLVNKKFVAAEDKPFNLLDPAKSSIDWIDEKTVLVATDFGKDSITVAGHPRTVKLWQRGEPLEQAKELLTIDHDHLCASFNLFDTPDGVYSFVFDQKEFWDWKYYYLDSKKKLVPVNLPGDARIQDVYYRHIIVLLKSEWRKHKAGSLLAVSVESMCTEDPVIEELMVPTANLAIQGASALKNSILVEVTENVAQQVYRLEKTEEGWFRVRLGFPEAGSVVLSSTNANRDEHLLWYEDFLTPCKLYFAKQGMQDVLLKEEPKFFDASNSIVEQLWATSKDGTEIPYYIIRRKDISLDGTNATLLNAYGGFDDSLTPEYLCLLGKSWVERGNVYVVANVRGGGEFGPAWHEAAIKCNKQKSFDDFIAVAEALIRRGVTSPKHFGIEGGSNGGLLVAAVMVQRPELFNAVICEAPLTDMLRYHNLNEGAGATWVGEYGDPGLPYERAALRRYSPLHNVKPKKEVTYPPIFILTSTNDDRVHPYHARVFADKLQQLGHQVYYYENTEGGHSGAANNKQIAFNHALEFSYLLQRLQPQQKLGLDRASQKRLELTI